MWFPSYSSLSLVFLISPQTNLEQHTSPYSLATRFSYRSTPSRRQLRTHSVFSCTPIPPVFHRPTDPRAVDSSSSFKLCGAPPATCCSFILIPPSEIIWRLMALSFVTTSDARYSDNVFLLRQRQVKENSSHGQSLSRRARTQHTKPSKRCPAARPDARVCPDAQVCVHPNHEHQDVPAFLNQRPERLHKPRSSPAKLAPNVCASEVCRPELWP